MFTSGINLKCSFSFILIDYRRLDSNALICDCQMLWLARMLNEKQSTTQAAANCEYPAKLNGKPVSAIVDDFNCSQLSSDSFTGGFLSKLFFCFFWFVFGDDFRGAEKPFLTEEPTDVEITFGGTVYFTCKAEGDPEPDIIWLYNK
jgi:peroxidase